MVALLDPRVAGKGWGKVILKSLPPVRRTGSLAEVATQATAGIEQLTSILQDIRSGRGTVGQLFTNDALYRELNGLVAAAEKADQPAAGGKAEDEPVLNEQQATPNRVGGDGAPSVAGREAQEKH